MKTIQLAKELFVNVSVMFSIFLVLYGAYWVGTGAI